jgi:hypothetical protein
VISPRVADRFPRILSKSMVLVLFRTSTLFNQDQINDPQLPSRSTVEILLRDFDAFTLYFPPEYSIPRVLDRAPHVHLKSTTLVRFGGSGFDDFKLFSFTFSQSVFTRSSRSVATCPLDLTIQILFGSSGFRPFNSQTSLSLEVCRFLPRVPLESDG